MEYTVVVRDELGGWYSATAPVLPGWTWRGSSHAHVLEQIEETLRAWLVELKSRGQGAPPDPPAVLVELGDARCTTVRRIAVRLEVPRLPESPASVGQPAAAGPLPAPLRIPLPVMPPQPTPPRERPLPADAAGVIFREWYLRRVPEECEHIARFLEAVKIPWRVRMRCAGSRRPDRPELFRAVRQAAETNSVGRRFFGEAVARVDARARAGAVADPSGLVADLLSDDAQARLAAQVAFAELDYCCADLLFPLVRSERDDVAGAAVQLLTEMQHRIESHAGRMLCMQCFRRDHRLHARVRPDASVDVFACPSCGLTRHLTHWPGPVICVLDSGGPMVPVSTPEGLRVNWLARARAKGFDGEELFDFDRVEIVRASDTEVEHFCVDVTSDTEPDRRHAYAGMECRVSPECRLGPNALRQLESVFGSGVTR